MVLVGQGHRFSCFPTDSYTCPRTWGLLQPVLRGKPRTALVFLGVTQHFSSGGRLVNGETEGRHRAYIVLKFLFMFWINTGDTDLTPYSKYFGLMGIVEKGVWGGHLLPALSW